MPTKTTIVPKINYPIIPRVKYVKRANLWVKTWFETDNKGTVHQKQLWSVNKDKL